MIYKDHVDTWETRADGNAATTHAVLEISTKWLANRVSLVVWSHLKYETKYNALGELVNEDGAPEEREEKGSPEVLYYFEQRDLNKPVETLQEFWELMGERAGLLRFDVDGETFWQAEPEATETPIEDIPEVDFSQYPDGSTIVF